MLHILVLFVLYLFPAAILFHFAIDTYFRNPSRSEFKLGSLALLASMMLFVEEFIRQILPVSYSAPLIFYAFGNFGALSAAFVMHFYFKITGFATRMRPRVYLTISYVLLVPSLLTLILRRNIYNSTHFYRVGIWIQPVYNTQYYIAITVGIMVMVGLSAMMYAASTKVKIPSVRKRFITMFYATLLILGWHVIFGVLPGLFSGFRQLPPYPYMFGDLVWLSMLRWAMSTQELLPPYGKQYKTLFNLVPVAIIVADTTSRILEANPTAKQLFGEHPLRLTELLPLAERQNATLIDLFLDQTTIHNFETELLRRDGTVMSALVSLDFVEVEGSPLSISVIRDITDRKKVEQRITHLAYYDSLTDLPNRASFYQLLETIVTTQGPAHKKLAVILVDIDYFKQINDSFGHEAGDRAIQHAACCMRSILQPGDVAARLGGDEFVLMVQSFSSRDEMLQVVTRIVNELNSEVETHAGTILLSASVGVAVYPDHGSTTDELIRSADVAMYQAKQMGRNRFIVFSHETTVDSKLNE